MYCVNENEIVLKTHKLCTIYESDDESQQDSLQISRRSSISCIDDNQLHEAEVVNLLKLTNYSIQTVQHDIQHIQKHLEVLERNIKRITKNGSILKIQMELQQETLE
ncbi:Hypothetical_protein [Hexamita inflata]|uniref:Hypothetical_protein n=1 Tax=Hexamita inflata TaxID=28002 RepID=A0AA86QVB2_9EUKA|nr:Hypothetical protein HINF_LOCUS49826 [Hexamita inflata]